MLAAGAGDGDERRHRCALASAPRRAGGDWRAARRGRRRSRLLQRHPLRRAPRGRLAVASAPAGGAVDGRAPGSGIRGGLHAGTVRPTAIGCGRGARCSGSLRGLPLPERLAPRRPDRPQSARDGLDLWGRVHGRLQFLAQHVGRRVRQAGRRPRRHELPCGALRLLRASGLEHASARTRTRATTPTWTRSPPCSG